MLKKINEHLLALVVFSLTLILIYNLFLKPNVVVVKKSELANYIFGNQTVNIADNYEKALLLDVMNVFNPDSIENNKRVLYDIEELHNNKFADITQKTGGEYKGLTWGTIEKLLGMYFWFLLLYLISIVFIHSLGKAFAIWKFVNVKKGHGSYFSDFIEIGKEYFNKVVPKEVKVVVRNKAVKVFIKGLLKTIAYFIIFSPSYVVAYSFKGSSISDSFPFFIFLAIFTNGLLINYSYRFYSLLKAESKKGYVDTAIVKGLNNNYDDKVFTLKNLIKFNKDFEGHIFNHIYQNANYQNILNIKELSALLITGIVIIEMALNIQGYLCYEMLQNILYKHYDVVIFIVILIFTTVKITELYADLKYIKMTRKYENI